MPNRRRSSSRSTTARPAAGTFFPQVRRFIGSANLYYVEFQRAPVQALPRGTSPASMGNLHTVCVRMLSTTAGVPVTVR